MNKRKRSSSILSASIGRPSICMEGLESRQMLHAGITGTGLTAQYFNNKDFTDLKLTRTDAQVNFAWAAGSPNASIASDTFAVRWTGQVIPHATASYTFYTSTDDGVRLWIDGKLVIDKLTNQPQTQYATKPIALTSGQAVDIRMDYYDNTGSATAKLYWSTASAAKAIIPQDHLLPVADTEPPPPPPPPPTTGVLRIDAAGSKSYSDASGNVWKADQYYSGGSPTLGAFNIAGTTDDEMYYTRRFGKSFSYAIPLASGNYTLKLLFADESYNAGGRKFNVSAEGKAILSNFDIVATGGKGAVVSRSFDLAVTDGKLNLAFTGVVNNATLSAIEITPKSVTAPSITWETKSASPTGRAEANGATVNDKLYVFGGFYSSGSIIIAQRRSDVFDPAKNTWTRLGDMPEAFTHAGMAVDGTTIWMVGQYAGNHPGPGSTHVWKYDTLTDDWTRGPDLPEARGAGAAAIVGRQLHFMGGMDETRTIECGEHWVLDLDDPDAKWIEKAPMPNPRNHPAAAGLNGYVYAIGGQHSQEAGQVSQSQVDRYDPTTDTWTQVASLPEKRSHIVTSTFVMNGKIIVLGGETAYQTQRNTIFSYDPAMNKWSLLGTLPAPRSTSVAGAIGDNQIVTTTGNAPSETDETWLGTLS